jgi:hypothetical protein
MVVRAARHAQRLARPGALARRRLLHARCGEQDDPPGPAPHHPAGRVHHLRGKLVADPARRRPRAADPDARRRPPPAPQIAQGLCGTLPDGQLHPRQPVQAPDPRGRCRWTGSCGSNPPASPPEQRPSNDPPPRLERLPGPRIQGHRPDEDHRHPAHGSGRTARAAPARRDRHDHQRGALGRTQGDLPRRPRHPGAACPASGQVQRTPLGGGHDHDDRRDGAAPLGRDRPLGGAGGRAQDGDPEQPRRQHRPHLHRGAGTPRPGRDVRSPLRLGHRRPARRDVRAARDDLRHPRRRCGNVARPALPARHGRHERRAGLPVQRRDEPRSRPLAP